MVDGVSSWHTSQTDRTHVPQPRVNYPVHLCYPPFHDVAKMLVVDIEVLSPNRTLCTLFELVLPVSGPARKAFQKYV